MSDEERTILHDVSLMAIDADPEDNSAIRREFSFTLAELERSGVRRDEALRQAQDAATRLANHLAARRCRW